MKPPTIIYLLKTCLVLSCFSAYGQANVAKDIKSFGAKGDGRTNDQAAFEKAAQFFNARGGNGKLIISKGTYLVGKQDVTKGANGAFYTQGRDVLHFVGVKNFTVSGTKGTSIIYTPGLKYGSFDPQTGASYQAKGYFINKLYGATIGTCVYFESSENIQITDLELNGNNQKFVLGGSYGDVGRQLAHFGIYIHASRSVTVNNLWVHHFGQDGIVIGNSKSDQKDNIVLSNCTFEYNARQGLSWVGGNDLLAKNCKFNHTGQASFYSPPGAGVDIEAEQGPIRNGKFVNCEFIDNKGCGLVADSGDSGNCSFDQCTFWGLDSWSVWINKPAFTVTNSKIYGSIVHGYNAPNDQDATKFINCTFQDKSYNGKDAYGNFLIETTGNKRVSFINCTMIANKKKLFWISIPAETKPEEKYQFDNCHIICNTSYGNKDYAEIFRGVRYKNTTFEFTDPQAKAKGNGLNDCCGPRNVDAGGNKTIYK